MGLVSFPLIRYPETANGYVTQAMDLVTSNLGWLFLLLGIGALFFCFWLAFGRFGNVKLGEPDEPPEYSDVHWVGMMFTAGVGAGLIAWGFAEPVFYLLTPPFGVEPLSNSAMEWAHMYPLFHWGIIPWAMYAIPAVPIAYMLYVKRVRYLRISVACEDALPTVGRETFKTAIDVAIMLGIIGGTATSLGLGVPLLSAFLTELTGIPDSNMMKLVVLVVWTLLFGASAYRGLKKGIKVLADINMVLAGLATLFILLAGPTLFILSLSVNSFGLLINNFWSMSFWMDPIQKSGFPEAWTVFYWAWWFAFGAFIGLFFGRISRGRTIKQLVLGVICWGSLGTWSFLLIAGGYSIYLETSGALPVTQILQQQDMFVLAAKILTSLPSGKVVLTAFIVLSVVFYATTLDSAAYVLASVCSKNLRNDQEPPKVSRIVWAAALAVLTAGLIVTEGLDAVKTSTVVSAVPLLPIYVLMCVSLIRWLQKDFGEHASSRSSNQTPTLPHK